MENLEAPKQTLTEGKKAKPDFLDMDKDGDKKEPLKKAAKEKSKGAIGEAVARVEKHLAEKYMGFKKAADKKMAEGEQQMSRAAKGHEKYGKEGMAALAKAGREGKNLDKVRDKYNKYDDDKSVNEGEYNEDMLSPGQKKIAKMSPPPGKIGANDLAALRAGKKKKAEGNAFSGAVAKAKATGQDEFEVDGKEYQVQEGWDDMMKAAKERSGPQPSGGSGIKQGTRYGGGRQTDEPDTDNETGEVAKKGRGRPKKDKFAR
jgi:hypothetical protein